MANCSKVAEIFEQASVAFGRLAQLTIDLKLFQAQQADSEPKINSKWSLKEIDQLKEAITRFGNDLVKIAETIETKTVNQIKHKLKSKAFQEAGLSEAPTESEQRGNEDKTESVPTNLSSTVDKGRRKQTLDQIAEDFELPAPKRPRPPVHTDPDEYADFDPDDDYSSHDIIPEKSNQLSSAVSSDNGSSLETLASKQTLLRGSVSQPVQLLGSKQKSIVKTEFSSVKPSNSTTLSHDLSTGIKITRVNQTASASKYEEYEYSEGSDIVRDDEDYDEDEEEDDDDDEEEENEH